MAVFASCSDLQAAILRGYRKPDSKLLFHALCESFCLISVKTLK